MCNQSPCVNSIDSNYILLFKILLKRIICGKARILLFKIPSYNAFYLYRITFYISILHTIVTYVHTIHNYNLPIVARISKDFLVAGHPGIKAYFACGSSFFTKGSSMENISIL